MICRVCRILAVVASNMSISMGIMDPSNRYLMVIMNSLIKNKEFCCIIPK